MTGREKTLSRLKIGVVWLLTAFSLVFYLYMYNIRKVNIPFHFIYFMPSILACLWWGRRGLILLFLLAVILPLVIEISPVNARIWNDFVDEAAIVFATLAIAELSERRFRLIGTLEEKVEARTRELSERNHELEAYTHTISHDLLGPLTIIKGFAEAARDSLAEGRTEDAAEEVARIEGGTDRMTSLTVSLLEYARVGSTEGKVVRVETSEVLEEALQDFAFGECDLAITPSLPAILADPLKVRQVFANLIGNALKYRSSQRPLSIEVGCVPEGEGLVFHVRDNGQGIEPEYFEEIFEPFKRLPGPASPGAGIGLATVKRAVEGWGGRVWVESAPGRGSVFYFSATAADHGG